MTNSKERSNSTRLNEILETLNNEGRFPISILTDSQGLSIASAASEGMNADKQSAVVAFIQKTAVQVSKQLGFSGSEEISLTDNDGRHLVCRSFKANGFDLILSVMINDRSASYRRLTSNAIHKITDLWSEYWE